MAVQRNDPYGAFNFVVEIDGVARAGFAEVSGLDQEIELITYRDGADPGPPRLLAGLAKPVMVTLRRGVTGDLSLQQWFDATRSGGAGPSRRDARVTLLDEARNAVLAWLLHRAFPMRLQGPALDAATTAVAIETLVLAAEAISVE